MTKCTIIFGKLPETKSIEVTIHNSDGLNIKDIGIQIKYQRYRYRDQISKI